MRWLRSMESSEAGWRGKGRVWGGTWTIPCSKLSITRWWFQIFVYFHPYLGEWSILTNIFQMGWNHQLDNHGDRFRPLTGGVMGYPSKRPCLWLINGDHRTTYYVLAGMILQVVALEWCRGGWGPKCFLFNVFANTFDASWLLFLECIYISKTEYGTWNSTLGKEKHRRLNYQFVGSILALRV